ncbi:MAG: hypothetical protein V4503_08735 [Gemmatimonadota bacterium]
MHIELTDHLRCPASHEEAFLVLLPDQMDGRRVLAGHLGCPICGWSTDWRDGVPDFGDGWRSEGTMPCDAESVAALLGLSGPGGWVALAGAAGALAEPLGVLLGGVSLVAVNPPQSLEPGEQLSVITSAAWPIKAQALRGVVLGADAADWCEQAVRSVLPGLRAVGVGAGPAESAAVETLASADELWVARRR